MVYLNLKKMEFEIKGGLRVRIDNDKKILRLLNHQKQQGIFLFHVLLNIKMKNIK